MLNLRMAASASLSVLALAGCAASSDPAPTASTESGYTSNPYGDRMRAACLDALPPVPASPDAKLDDAALAELAARPELARGFLEVYRVSCSTRGYEYETPYCSRMPSYEAVDTNYAPTFRIEQHQSYRDVIARVDAGQLVLTTAVPDGGVFRPSFAVDGAPGALHATMKPPQGWALPDDLQQVASSFESIELTGALTNGSLVLSRTEAPVVTWNFVQCERAVLRMDFTPAKGSAN